MKRIKSRRVKKCRNFIKLRDLAVISLPKNHGKLFNELCNKYNKWVMSLDENIKSLPEDLLVLGDKINQIKYSRHSALTQFIHDLMSRKYKVSYERVNKYECLVLIQDKFDQYYEFTDKNFRYELVKTNGPIITDISHHL